jgi:hypothetical protein
MDAMTKPRGPLAAAAVTAAKIAPGALVAHVGGTLAADQIPTWPEWAKGLVQLVAGAAVTVAMGAAGVDPAIAAGPAVGGITGAGHRAARKVQLDRVVAGWSSTSSASSTSSTSSASSSNQVTGGQGQGASASQGLHEGARRR